MIPLFRWSFSEGFFPKDWLRAVIVCVVCMQCTENPSLLLLCVGFVCTALKTPAYGCHVWGLYAQHWKLQLTVIVCGVCMHCTGNPSSRLLCVGFVCTGLKLPAYGYCGWGCMHGAENPSLRLLCVEFVRSALKTPAYGYCVWVLYALHGNLQLTVIVCVLCVHCTETPSLRLLCVGFVCTGLKTPAYGCRARPDDWVLETICRRRICNV